MTHSKSFERCIDQGGEWNVAKEVRLLFEELLPYQCQLPINRHAPRLLTSQVKLMTTPVLLISPISGTIQPKMIPIPNELLSEIASYLQDRTDCGNYRLVNKRFAEIGAAHFFHVFPCKPTMATLEKMKSIIYNTNPKFKASVKVLDYEGRREEDYVNQSHQKPEFTFIREIVEGFVAASPITEFRATELRHGLILPENFDASFRDTCINLTSVDIHMYCSKGPYGDSTCFIGEEHRTLHDFLMSLRKLKSLKIGFKGKAYPKQYEASSMITLQQPWPLLQKLHLECMMIPPKVAFTLLKNHEATLKCFHLNGLYVPRSHFGFIAQVEEWHRVFKQMESINHLQHGTLNMNAFERDHNFRYTIQVGGRSVEINTNMSNDVGLGKLLLQKKNGNT